MCIEKVEIYTLSPTGNPMQYFNTCFPGREDCYAIYHYSTNSCYVTDAIQDAYEKWQPEIPVFISAPTGSGKNYFVQQKLLPYVMTYNGSTENLKKRVLVLSNRVALNRQNKLELAKVVDRYLPLNALSYEEACHKCSCEELDKMKCFDCIHVCSYQQLLTSPEILNGQYSYVVIDEAHFFIQDAIFNYQTQTILSKIVSTFQSAVRIYMSATFEDVFLPLVQLEEQMWNRRPYWEREQHFQFIFYDLPCQYDYISEIQAIPEKEEELVPYIEQSKEKWLIFVADKEKGAALASALENEAVFICSETKVGKRGNKAVYDQLVETQTYKPRILISTAVIDNGISLKDEKIRHVAIFVPQPVSFLQMLGRVRIQKKQKITLYIPQYSSRTLKQKLKQEMQELCYRLAFDAMNTQQRWYECNQVVQSQGWHHPGFGMDDQTKAFSYSPLSKLYLVSTILTLKYILYFSEGDTHVSLSGSAEIWRSRILNMLEAKQELDYNEARLYAALSDEDCIQFWNQASINEDIVLGSFEKEFFCEIEGINLRYRDGFDFKQTILYARIVDLKKRLSDSKSATEHHAILAELQQLIKTYNRMIEPDKPFDIVAAQAAWLGKEYKPGENVKDATMQTVTKDAVLAWCEQNIFPLTEYENAKSVQKDKMLCEYGFDTIKDNRLALLQNYMMKKGGEIKQQKAINGFLAEEKIPYRFESKKFSSTKGEIEKGKVYWILIETQCATE